MSEGLRAPRAKVRRGSDTPSFVPVTFAAMNVGILGSGSWATAIAKMLCHNVDTLHWWVRSQDTVDELMTYGHNPRYIQSISFPKEKLRVTTDMQAVVDACDVLVVVIPSLHLDSVFRERELKGMEGKILFSAIKGMVSEYDSIPARYLHKGLSLIHI